MDRRITELKLPKSSQKDMVLFTWVQESCWLNKWVKALKLADWHCKKSDKNNWLMTRLLMGSFKTDSHKSIAKCRATFYKDTQKQQDRPKPLLTLILNQLSFCHSEEVLWTLKCQNKLLISSNKIHWNWMLKSPHNKHFKKFVLNLKTTDSFLFILSIKINKL